MPFDEQQRAHFQELQLASAYLSCHPRFRELMEELEYSADVYSSAQRDLKTHLRSKGFELPDGWTFKVSHDSPITFTACVNNFCVSYTLDVTVTTG